MAKQDFPPFDLTRLLRTVFSPKPGERVAILIDLDDPKTIKDFAFLKDEKLTIQRHAFDVFYQGLFYPFPSEVPPFLIRWNQWLTWRVLNVLQHHVPLTSTETRSMQDHRGRCRSHAYIWRVVGSWALSLLAQPIS